MSITPIWTFVLRKGEGCANSLDIVCRSRVFSDLGRALLAATMRILLAYQVMDIHQKHFRKVWSFENTKKGKLFVKFFDASDHESNT